MTTIRRADWSNVTLGEYAALDILRRDDAEKWMDRYWLSLRDADPFRNDDDEVTRLSPEGKAWLAGLHDTVVSTLDEDEQIVAARAFLKSMGTLLTMNISKAIKGRVAL